MFRRGSVNQRFPILETKHIPPVHTERATLILVCVISIEESVAESLLFGLPSFKLKLRTRLCFLLSAPFNARYDGIFGYRIRRKHPVTSLKGFEEQPDLKARANLL